jgi:predicted Rossmann fold flavoprotein
LIKSDISIIGGGASGLMLASLLDSSRFILLEGSDTIGKKLKVSGGGRCNLTNKILSEDNYYGDKGFIKPILDSFSNIDLLDCFRDVDLVIKNKTQYFCKYNSQDIINHLSNKIDQKNLYLNTLVKSVEFKDGRFDISTNRDSFSTKKLVVASGAESFKNLGATSIAYEIAKKFGHNVIKPLPALVGFTVQPSEFWFKKLSGISLKVKIRASKKSFYSDLLFTHKGVSGPAILNSSLYWSSGKILVDFLPDHKIEFNYPKRLISSNLPLPKRFIKEFLLSQGIKDRVALDITDQDLKVLSRLKAYEFAPAGNFGFSKAEVTKGGVDTKEIDSFTMQSKLQNGLFFIGESLDVTGELGGYNLQWAFSSANRVKL